MQFAGECHDVLESGVCGEEALGERLYLGEDGQGYCDCDEGWLRYRGRCYQEFTPAFCPGRYSLSTNLEKKLMSPEVRYSHSTNRSLTKEQ